MTLGMRGRRWIAASMRMQRGAIPTLDTVKLLGNALTSIRLGVEDFQRSQAKQANGGDPDRALSVVRNLVASVLGPLEAKLKFATYDIQPSLESLHGRLKSRIIFRE